MPQPITTTLFFGGKTLRGLWSLVVLLRQSSYNAILLTERKQFKHRAVRISKISRLISLTLALTNNPQCVSLFSFGDQNKTLSKHTTLTLKMEVTTFNLFSIYIFILLKNIINFK